MLHSISEYIFFFKQKTAYEMRISDWSSDVCSSDLALVQTEFAAHHLVVGQRVAVDVDALDISPRAFADVEGDRHRPVFGIAAKFGIDVGKGVAEQRSEEHTSELQSLMRISYAVFCLKKKKQANRTPKSNNYQYK